jgi:putative transposase
MASRNSVKIYAENTIYHVYNRGVEKRDIFMDDQDFKVFLGYLKEYLSPPPKVEDLIKKEFTLKDHVFKGVERQPNNYHGQIELLAYSLMPNHFHLILKQNEDKHSIQEFMHSLLLRYSTYFNKKYKRVGRLFQDRYKAVIVMDEVYLLHLSRYIHANPYEYTHDLVNAYSSYAEYLHLRNTNWINTKIILSYFENSKSSPEFKKINSYKSFVESYVEEQQEKLEGLTLE